MATRILMVCSDVGGVGKTTETRGLAEALPDAPVIEIESTARIREYDDQERVIHFPMRADRRDIDSTGGQAARAEFDPAINCLIAVRSPHIVDIGANTAGSLFASFDDELMHAFSNAEIELAVLLVLTADPAALATGSKLLAMSKGWAAAQFAVENQVRGNIDAQLLKRIADGMPVTTLRKWALEPHAVAFLQATGLRAIPTLTPADFAAECGFNQARRICADLRAFRLAVMESVLPAAKWLAS